MTQLCNTGGRIGYALADHPNSDLSAEAASGALIGLNTQFGGCAGTNSHRNATEWAFLTLRFRGTSRFTCA